MSTSEPGGGTIDDPLAVSGNERRGAETRPIHVRWRYLALVALGGTIGSALREGLVLAFPTTGFPTTVFIINIVGAFVLGALLEGLSWGGPDEGGRRAIRLFGGTGVLGGFTTYSALATSSAQLLAEHWGTGITYAALSLVAGYAASWLGIIAAATGSGASKRGARS